jgi:hypothetical protein
MKITAKRFAAEGVRTGQQHHHHRQEHRLQPKQTRFKIKINIQVKYISY